MSDAGNTQQVKGHTWSEENSSSHQLLIEWISLTERFVENMKRRRLKEAAATRAPDVLGTRVSVSADRRRRGKHANRRVEQMFA